MANSYSDTKYADTKYYQPKSDNKVPSGPLAIPNVIKGDDGNLHTVYLDINTGQQISDLKGYTILDNNGNYYTPSDTEDTNKDGSIDDDEVSTFLKSQGAARTETGSGQSVVAGGGPPGTASNNFGYTSKPSWAGAATMAASLANPALGAVASMASKAVNVANMDAVNSARKGLGLSALSGAQMAKQAMKDNKGQIANVNIGDNKYSVGFEAMSPDNKTNLTYNEAKTRAAMLGQKVTETPKDEVTPGLEKQDKSLISKITGLDKGFARRALGIEKKQKKEEKISPVEKQSPVERVTGIQKGWLSRALTDLTTVGKVSPEVAVNLPDMAPTPTTKPSEDVSTPTTTPTRSAIDSAPTGTGYSSAASVGLSPDVTDKAIGPSQANPLGIGAGSVGFAGTGVNKPSVSSSVAEHPGLGGIIDGSTPDRIGRVGLMSVDPSKMGLQPAMAAQIKSFQNAAVAAGIANKLSINVLDAVRTPEQQAAIKAAGYSKTNFGYHNIGLAADISPTAINEKDQIVDQQTLAQSRQIAKNLGLSTLNAAFDPAHVEAHVKGLTARQIGQQAIDPTTGLPGLSPEQDLGVRQNSVPTPTARPDPTATALASKSYDSQIGLNQPAVSPTNPDDNAFGQTKASMDTLGTTMASNETGKLSNTPAGLAAMGFTARTPEEKAAISRTVAGELGQKSLKGLVSKDPATRAQALAEVGNMVATVENRAATTQYSGIAKTLAPSQYNANMAKNAKVTNQNYAANPAVSKAVSSFYEGGIPGTNYSATNYHATKMSNPPAWSGAMTSPTAVGQHTFGSLPGYSPDAANRARMDAFGTMAGTQFSAGKKTDDHVSNPGFSGAGTPTGMSPSNSGLSTGLGVSSHKDSPGYGGAGLGYSGAGSGAAAGSLGNPGGSSGAQGASGSQGSSSSGSGNGSGSGSGGSSGSSNSRSGDSSPAGGYGTSASKGSTGGL